MIGSVVPTSDHPNIVPSAFLKMSRHRTRTWGGEKQMLTPSFVCSWNSSNTGIGQDCERSREKDDGTPRAANLPDHGCR
ncbi:hypothetical protein LshimejAT787_0308400 [Lyophyllum shimeji]|uniref:Uncharacterized protein n=1 Tax=Lyophyllum shimeji TaxID=47721 RepID=A0A9P3UKM8_LYOSH|nr:hypothetical protein LshimejAT787_0308400 [Lyophyllum shimeji]